MKRIAPMELKVGQKAPNFVLPASNDTEISSTGL